MIGVVHEFFAALQPLCHLREFVCLLTCRHPWRSQYGGLGVVIIGWPVELGRTDVVREKMQFREIEVLPHTKRNENVFVFVEGQ